MRKRLFYQTDGEERVIIRLGEEIGEGGEAKVFHLDPLAPGQKQLANKYVVKIYEPSSVYGEGRLDPEPKLLLLDAIWKARKKQLKGFYFPKYLVYNEHRRCVGFLMPFCHGYSLTDIFGCFENQRTVERMFRPPFLRDINKNWTRVELATLALNILKKLDSLHQAGILMCDVNTSNILVNENLNSFFIDVDSYQVGGYPCPMFRREYASPRIMAKGCPSDEMLNSNDENYSIAVLLFQILFLGQHPYARSGRDSFEQFIMDREFVYPLTYKRANAIPKGPWQNIWYSLPFKMKKAFDSVFGSNSNHNYPRLRRWIELFEDYKDALVNNSLKRDIFPVKETILRQDTVFLGSECSHPEPTNHPELRQFDTVICDETPSQSFLFLEFGSDNIRSWKKVKGKWKCRCFYTGHFGMIDPNGYMDIERLAGNKHLQHLMPSISGITPPITHVRAFGGICLRDLSNREEVVGTFKKVTGLNIGVLTGEEEASCFIDMVLRQLSVSNNETLSVVDVGGFAAEVFTRTSTGDIVCRSLSRLGSLTLGNWFFSTSTKANRTSAVFSSHDATVEELVSQSLIDMSSSCLVGTGALTALIPEGQVQVLLTLDELIKMTSKLTTSLCSNRPDISRLNDDYRGNNAFVSKNTTLRLALPVYISVMRQLGIEQIHVLRIGLGKAYINNYLTTIDHG